MSRLALVVVCVAFSATSALASPSGSAKTFFVSAKVPTRSTVRTFVDGAFKETVTCQEACRVAGEVVIKASAAKQLGFSNVKTRYVVVATNKGMLKGKTPTKLALVPTAEAKRRLPKATTPVALFGSVQAFPTGQPGVNYSVAWSSLLLASTT